MMDAAEPWCNDTGICTGGFLIEALTVMRNKVREIASLSPREKDDLFEQVFAVICLTCWHGYNGVCN